MRKDEIKTVSDAEQFAAEEGKRWLLRQLQRAIEGRADAEVNNISHQCQFEEVLIERTALRGLVEHLTELNTNNEALLAQLTQKPTSSSQESSDQLTEVWIVQGGNFPLSAHTTEEGATNAARRVTSSPQPITIHKRNVEK